MFNPSLKLSLFALASTALAGATAKPLPPLSPDTQRHFAAAQQMVDIGGRRLHLYCSGSGPVTVVFDAYGTGAGSSWFAVQPHVARTTRACVYDRAGFGFSEPSPNQPTSANAVEDLHKLPGSAGIAPPYVMVGSSFGGANAQLFAYRYPNDVKGLVLVEPMHEDEENRLLKVTQGKLKMMRDIESQIRAACTAESEKGFTPGSEMWATCIGNWQQGRPSAVAAMENARRATPAYWKAVNAEVSHYPASSEELRTARKPFGDLPMIVLSRSISPYATPGKPQSPLNKAMEDENQKIMKEIAALSTQGTLRRIPGARHVVHEDKPEAVVKAIADIVAKVR